MSPISAHPDLRLLAEGAVWLGGSGTLVVADVHLGKSATFRARGLAVPEGEMARDLGRLADLARRYPVRHLVVAGDFFHAPAGFTPELERALGDFLDALPADVTLVAGNHDRRLLKRLPAALRPVAVLEIAPGLRIVHDPADAETGGGLHLAGHLHPVVRIPDGPRSSLRMPCFLHRGGVLVLPAFGSFTGGALVKPGGDDRVFVALHGRTVELPQALFARG